MKQTAKVLSITIDLQELQDIRKAYEQMIAKIDFQNMSDAMNVLGPKRSFEVTVAILKDKLEECYDDIMAILGPVSDDGTIDIDLLDYPSAGCGTMGFILKLNFDRDKECWIWTLNLEVASLYVYPLKEE